MGDRFDGLFEPALMVARTYTGLVLCDGVEDAYRASVPAGEGLLVELRHAPEEGDLSLWLDLEHSSDHLHGVERLGVDPADEAREIGFYVRGRPGRSVPYTLALWPQPGGACAPDGFEGALGNDDAEHASPLSAGSVGHRLCPEDEDWFFVDLPAGVRAEARSFAAGGDIASTLIDPDGQVLAHGVPADGAVVATADTGRPGRHHVRVRPVAPAGPVPALLSLSVVAAPEARALACPHAASLVPGEAVSFPGTMAVNRALTSCGPGMGADLIGRFELAEPAIVSLEPIGASLGGAIALLADCADPDTELRCVEGRDAALEGVTLEAGTWFVAWETIGETRPTLLFSVRSGCERDEDCEGDRICEVGFCRAPCAGDEDCSGAQTCEAATGRCLEPEICRTDEDCLGPRACDPAGACFAPECAENADCPGACVDRLCAERAPQACHVDVPCPEPRVCALGVCVLDRPCAGAAECPAGAPLCDPATGACVACLIDADCVPTELCWLGRCEYAGGCEVDLDCPGERSCSAQSGDCLAALDCAGDRFDALAEAAVLAPRTYTGLVLCDGAADVFRVASAPNEGLRVILRHDPAAGDLVLSLSEGVGLLERSDGLSGVERVGVDPGLVGRDLEVIVEGRAGRSVPYALTVERLPDDGCLPDALEGLPDNDVPERAGPISLGETSVKLCPGDEDWLALTLGAGSRWSVSADPAIPAEDLRLTLVDPAGSPLAEAAQAGGVWEVEADVAQTGTHRLHLRRSAPGPRLGVTLHVAVEPAPDAAGLACAAPPELPADLPRDLLPLAPVHRLDVGCGLGDTADQVVYFDLQEPSLVSIDLIGAAFGSALAIQRRCGDVETEVACRVDAEFVSERVVLEDWPLSPGRWYVVVKTNPAGRRPRLLLTVSGPCGEDAECADGQVCHGGTCRAPCEVDGDCAGAQACEAGGGHCLEPAVCSGDLDCAGLRVCEHGGCLMPECAEHLDCPAVCVNRQCAERVPQACYDAAACPEPQVCAPLGACALDAPCEEDADCPPGAPRCAVASGTCVVCGSHEDCAAAERCEVGLCELSELCGNDGDCPGDRACVLERCEPSGGCVGDPFDEVGAPPLLAARTFAGLVLCDGAEDLYRAVASAGEGLRVVLRHEPRAGDLSLHLAGTDGDGQPVALRSDGRHGVEVLGLDAAQSMREVEIVVRGRPGASVGYDLTLERVPPEACVEDVLEGLLGDDDPDHATPVGIGTFAHKLCPGDEDWFALQLASGSRLTTRSVPQAAAPGLELVLLGPEGEVLAQGADDEGARLLERDIEAPGRHLLRLHSEDPDERSTLRLDVHAEAAFGAGEMACAHARQLTADVPLRLPDTLPVDRLVVQCGLGGLGGDHVAWFTLAEAATVTVEARGLGVGGVLSVRAECVDAATEQACLADLDFSEENLLLEDLALAGGTWFVVVEPLASGRRPELRLTVQ